MSTTVVFDLLSDDEELRVAAADAHDRANSIARIRLASDRPTGSPTTKPAPCSNCCETRRYDRT